MVVSINYIQKQAQFRIKTTHLQGELNLIAGFYFDIVSKALGNSEIQLVTVSPQKYSLGFEISPNIKKAANKTKVLINKLAIWDQALLRTIVSEEEFNRTLLFIVETANILSESELIKILLLAKQLTLDGIPYQIIFCEDDSDTLCIYNANLSVMQIEAISKNYTKDISIIFS